MEGNERFLLGCSALESLERVIIIRRPLKANFIPNFNDRADKMIDHFGCVHGRGGRGREEEEKEEEGLGDDCGGLWR